MSNALWPLRRNAQPALRAIRAFAESVGHSLSSSSRARESMVDHLAGKARPDAAHSPDPLLGRRKVNGDAASPPIDEEATEQVKVNLRDLGCL